MLHQAEEAFYAKEIVLVLQLGADRRPEWSRQITCHLRSADGMLLSARIWANRLFRWRPRVNVSN